MDYKKIGWCILFTFSFLAGYVLLRIYVSPYTPFFENYPEGILVPYGTLAFTLLSYYFTRNISTALEKGGIALATLIPLVILYGKFPEYTNTIIIAIICVNAIGQCIYRRYYIK